MTAATARPKHLEFSARRLAGNPNLALIFSASAQAFQFLETAEQMGQVRRKLRVFHQYSAQAFADLPNNGAAVQVVNFDAVVSHEPFLKLPTLRRDNCFGSTCTKVQTS